MTIFRIIEIMGSVIYRLLEKFEELKRTNNTKNKG